MSRLTVVRIKSAGPGRHLDSDGLYLIVRETGSRQWLLRIQADGKRRDLGLGKAEVALRTKYEAQAAEKIPLLDRRSLTLAEAREKADAYRRLVKAGLDPVEERKRKPAAIPSFERATRHCHEELKKGWKNKKHIDSWLASMVNYVVPALGDKRVDTITSMMVRDAMAPIWLQMPETAQRILQRISAVLDFAHIKGWRADEISLRSVRKGLPRQPTFESHFEAMPYAEVPAYMKQLEASTTTAGRDALRFTVLTAVRSSESRFARWTEIDLDRATWSIPPNRMKMGQSHLVPLASDALDILKRRHEARTSDDGLIFFSSTKKPLSDMTMTKVLRDDKVVGYTVHGFRSSFTDWAAEETSFPKEVVDKALAHKLPDRVEAAYRRTDFFQKRRKLMDAWATYLARRPNVGELADAG